MSSRLSTQPRERKRKAPEELSSNPHTVKARKRVEGMMEAERTVDKAKKADAAAVCYSLKRLKKTEQWKAATKEEEQLKKEDAERVNQRR
jgi:hypothetical protein